jgi:hypothetical protein
VHQWTELQLIQQLTLSTPHHFAMYNVNTLTAYRKFAPNGVFIDESGEHDSMLKSGFFTMGSRDLRLKKLTITVNGYQGIGRIVVAEFVSESCTSRLIQARPLEMQDFEIRNLPGERSTAPAFIVIDGGGNLNDSLPLVFCKMSMTLYGRNAVKKALLLPSLEVTELSRCYFHLSKQITSYFLQQNEPLFRYLGTWAYRSVYASESGIDAVKMCVSFMLLTTSPILTEDTHGTISLATISADKFYGELCYDDDECITALKNQLQFISWNELISPVKVQVQHLQDGQGSVMLDFSEIRKRTVTLFKRFNKIQWKSPEDEAKYHRHSKVVFPVHGVGAFSNPMYNPSWAEYMKKFVFKYWPFFVESSLKRRVRGQYASEGSFRDYNLISEDNVAVNFFKYSKERTMQMNNLCTFATQKMLSHTTVRSRITGATPALTKQQQSGLEAQAISNEVHQLAEELLTEHNYSVSRNTVNTATASMGDIWSKVSLNESQMKLCKLVSIYNQKMKEHNPLKYSTNVKISDHLRSLGNTDGVELKGLNSSMYGAMLKHSRCVTNQVVVDWLTEYLQKYLDDMDSLYGNNDNSLTLDERPNRVVDEPPSSATSIPCGIPATKLAKGRKKRERSLANNDQECHNPSKIAKQSHWSGFQGLISKWFG